MDDFLQKTFLGNTVADYGLALLTILAVFAIANLLKWLIIRRLHRWAKRTATSLDDQLVRLTERPALLLIYLGGVYVALQGLELSSPLEQGVEILGVILTALLVIQLTGSLAEYGLRIYGFMHRDQPNLQQSLNALIPALRVVIWAVGIVFVLDNLGFDISAVVAGLGIGGVAIALASQGILQDLFSYFSILLDRPFEIDDFIIVGDMVGTVERIGIKTTRLRSLTGEQLVMANTDLTGSRIQNFHRMEQRRIVFNLGVTYETGIEQLKQIPVMVQAAAEAVENVVFDRAHFASFGDFSLNFEVVYFVTTSDYALYMDAQQAINLAIKQRFDEAGIDFAYPTQLVYLDKGMAQENHPQAAKSGSLNGKGQ